MLPVRDSSTRMFARIRKLISTALLGQKQDRYTYKHLTLYHHERSLFSDDEQLTVHEPAYMTTQIN